MLVILCNNENIELYDGYFQFRAICLDPIPVLFNKCYHPTVHFIYFHITMRCPGCFLKIKCSYYTFVPFIAKFVFGNGRRAEVCTQMSRV